MDSHVWRTIYQMIVAVDRSIPRCGRKPSYKDALIVGMYVWSVGHDRPLCWACSREHYSSCFRPRELPSVSQFCRRIKTARCQRILQGVQDRLAQRGTGSGLSFLDGRALVVGAHSKDRQARRGRVSGGFARGYKLHAWATEEGRIPLWSVTPLNVSEKRVAKELVSHGTLSRLVLADTGYDSGPLYDTVAEHGMLLLTPMIKKNAGQGHRRQSHHRLAAARAWDGIAGYVYRQRLSIERFFGHQASLGGGLGPLPAWVRTLERVRRWVGVKLIIYNARIDLRRAAG